MEAFYSLAVVEFYSNGCQTCQALAPLVQQLESAYPHVKFYRVDADQSAALVARFRVTTLPTLLFLRHGEIVARTVGLKPRQQLFNLMQCCYGLDGNSNG